MKKIILFTLALTIAISGVQAQKQNNRKHTVTTRVSSSVDGTIDLGTESLQALDIIQLPASYDGLHTPLAEVLKERCTTRNLLEEELPLELISSLLWSTYGFNRPDEHKRVAPSAVNVQEYDIYLFTHEGVYLYNAEKNALLLVVKGDHRGELSQQKHFAAAPISIVLVANYDRMEVFKNLDDRDFYAAVDAGYISQNIYLFCASAHLGTVACGAIDRDTIHKLLNIKNGRAMLAHPVGRK